MLARSTYKLDSPFSNFGLEYYTARNYVMSCFSHRTEAFFDQVSLLSHFKHLFELLGPGFHRLLLLYVRIKLKKHF